MATSTIPPTISPKRSFGFFRPFGGSPNGSSSVGRVLTLAAFSKATSISTLIASSLCVNLFHLTNGPSQIRPCLVEAVQRRDLVIVRPSERILRLNYLNVVGHSCSEAVARLVDFFFRKLHAQIRNLYLVTCRIEIDQRGFYLQPDLVPQIRLLLLQFLNPQVRTHNVRANSAARKQRHTRLHCVVVSRDSGR